MWATNSNYQLRMDRVAEAIAMALRDERSPSLEELASAAALSPFHFHRVYRLLTGETTGETIRRLQLTRALELVQRGESITRAAQASGYGSSQSLAKAMKQRVGASISELRANSRVVAEIGQLRTNSGGSQMTFELVEHSPVRIACRCVTGPYSRLNLAYHSLFEDFCASADPEEIRGVYGIPIDDPRHVPETEHRFISALGVSDRVVDAGAGIDLRQMGGGQFALARFIGPYADVPTAIDELYAKIFHAGHQLRDSETFLHYVDQPDSPDGEDVVHETHIYVPIA